MKERGIVYKGREQISKESKVHRVVEGQREERENSNEEGEKEIPNTEIQDRGGERTNDSRGSCEDPRDKEMDGFFEGDLLSPIPIIPNPSMEAKDMSYDGELLNEIGEVGQKKLPFFSTKILLWRAAFGLFESRVKTLT
jgi:hypothetical protein